MLTVSALAGFGGSGPASVASLSFIESQVDTAGSVYTFSGVGFGTSQANRKIVISVMFSTGDGGVVSSMTVGGGGNAASFVVGQGSTGATGRRSEIWYYDLGTGSDDGNVTVTISASPVRCGIGVYAVYGAEASAHDTGVSVADPLIETIDIPTGGVCIGAARDASSSTFTWTNLTEDFDQTMESSTTQTGASDAFSTEQSGLSITCNPSNAASEHAMVLASWGPA
jgi:hypothetical protein